MSASAAAQAPQLQFFLPITKVDKKKRTVSGYASTPTKDLDGEIISLDAVKAALPSYMEWRNIREMHRLSAVGTAAEAHVDGTGLFLTAKITDDVAWEKCAEGVYKGFSIGGRKLDKVGDTVTEIEMTEISVVDRPCNPDCRFTVAKRAKDAAGASAVLVKAKTPSKKAVKAFAKAFGELIKDGPPAAHDGFSLPAAPPKTEKREFTQEQRDSAAESGAAFPDGSFPIKNEEDLRNAISAFGRAKNKPKAKAHIKARAKALGKESLLPEKWSKAAASPPRGDFLDIEKPLAPAPAFLTLAKASPSIASSALRKSMSTAGTLAYCFDSIRNAQRSLLSEAKREGGDKKDAALAADLGRVAQTLAAVIGQKATHEGAEALDMSDADDQWLDPEIREEIIMSAAKAADLAKNVQDDPIGAAVIAAILGKRAPLTRAACMKAAEDHLKKARKLRKGASACIKAVHDMHKASYMAKLAKAKKAKQRDDDDDDDDKDFDHQAAMEKLHKAFSDMEKMGTEMKAARGHLEKAARFGGATQADASPKITDCSPSDLATASPGGDQRGSAPPLYPADGGVYPGKAAGATAPRTAISPEHSDALVKAARLEGELEALRRVPMGALGGRRPMTFDFSKVNGGGFALPDGTSAEPDAVAKREALFRGVDAARLGAEDDDIRKAEGAKVLGNMLTCGHFGHSIFDANFRGAAAGK